LSIDSHRISTCLSTKTDIDPGFAIRRVQTDLDYVGIDSLSGQDSCWQHVKLSPLSLHIASSMTCRANQA